MRRIKPWVRTCEIWLAIIALVAGSYGCGFVVATTQDRTARAAELSVNATNYAAALAAKDKLINSLTKATITATGQAADAVATAAVAAGTAASKSKADDAEVNRLKQNQKQR